MKTAKFLCVKMITFFTALALGIIALASVFVVFTACGGVSITLSTSTMTINNGASFSLALYEEGEEVTSGITWSSSNASASVDSEGVVKGELSGDAIITGTTKNGSATCSVTVEDNGYFFDSTATANGTGTKSSPFNDLDEAVGLDIEEGENIYIKRGSDFKQNLNLVGLSGTAETTLVITDYGDSKDAMPKIDGNDMTGSGVVYIRNCEYMTVENLELYDSYDAGEAMSGLLDGDAEDYPDADLVGKDKRGVMITAGNEDALADDATADDQEVYFYTDITIKDLYIHDIKGITDWANNGMSSNSKGTGGVLIFVEDPYSSFDGLTITGCEIENVDNVGIGSRRSNGGSSEYSNYDYTTSIECTPYGDNFVDYAFRNLEISHNEIHNIGKNAIFLRGAYQSVIEYNTVHDTTMRCYTGNQIVTRSVYEVAVQYNEGYNNFARVNTAGGEKLMDGCMLDPDLLSRDTIWQYNYSHDNNFGLFLNCTGTGYSASSSDDKCILRHNLSVNDHGEKGIVYINYSAKNMEIYNNTFITANDAKYIFQTQDSGDARVFNIYNNIVYNTSASGEIDLNYSKGSVSNNLIYSVAGASIDGLDKFKTYNTDGIYEDPQLLLGMGESVADRTGYTDVNIEVGKPLPSSPVYGKGAEITEVLMGVDDKYVPDVTTDMAGGVYTNVIGALFGF